MDRKVRVYVDLPNGRTITSAVHKTDLTLDEYSDSLVYDVHDVKRGLVVTTFPNTQTFIPHDVLRKSIITVEERSKKAK